MNKTESRYEDILKGRKALGEIILYEYEPMSIRLGSNLFYIPDFMVMNLDGTLEFHEVKGGFIREDSNVKIKAAATKYPYFRFLLCQYKKGEWNFRDIPVD